MARSMRYSVVMLAFGDAIREASMVAALNKIRVGATTPQSDYEIIIVNNGRVYGTSDPRLEAFGDVRVIHRPTNEGVCSRNYGLELAKGEFIIQVDDDVLVAPGFDQVLLAPYKDPQVGATGQEGFYQDSTWGLLIDDRRRPRPGQFCDLVMGYCWSWRNEPRFRYDWDFSPFWHEESDLQLQIRSAGYRILSTPPVATHRSLHDWQETHADGPTTGTSIAERNFFKLVDKWSGLAELAFEGPSVGLIGPAPGKRPER